MLMSTDASVERLQVARPVAGPGRISSVDALRGLVILLEGRRVGGLGFAVQARPFPDRAGVGLGQLRLDLLPDADHGPPAGHLGDRPVDDWDAAAITWWHASRSKCRPLALAPMTGAGALLTLTSFMKNTGKFRVVWTLRWRPMGLRRLHGCRTEFEYLAHGCRRTCLPRRRSTPGAECENSSRQGASSSRHGLVIRPSTLAFRRRRFGGRVRRWRTTLMKGGRAGCCGRSCRMNRLCAPGCCVAEWTVSTLTM